MGWLSVIIMVFIAYYLLKFIAYICETVWVYFCEGLRRMLGLLGNPVEQEARQHFSKEYLENSEEQEAEQELSRKYELFQKMCALAKLNIPEREHFQNICEEPQLDLLENFSVKDKVLVNLLQQNIQKLCRPDDTTVALPDEEKIKLFKQLTGAILLSNSFKKCKKTPEIRNATDSQ